MHKRMPKYMHKHMDKCIHEHVHMHKCMNRHMYKYMWNRIDKCITSISIYKCICLNACISVCLSICISVCLSICISVKHIWLTDFLYVCTIIYFLLCHFYEPRWIILILFCWVSFHWMSAWLLLFSNMSSFCLKVRSKNMSFCHMSFCRRLLRHFESLCDHWQTQV